MITVELINHACFNGNEKHGIATFLCSYPRIIHSEFMTHRVFSRNASSSRAIPVRRMIATVLDNPFPFEYVGENQSSMQAAKEVPEDIKAKFKQEWEELKGINCAFASRWALEYNIHKQTANRVLEPFSNIVVLVTSTYWDNYFELRDHKDAQPEFQVLSRKMREALYASNQITFLDRDEWYVPFIRPGERFESVKDKLLTASARCARTSYKSHATGVVSTLDEDLDLSQKLFTKPLHASPFEHCAISYKFLSWFKWANKLTNMNGNFAPYAIQLRKVIERYPESFFPDSEGKILTGNRSVLHGSF